MKLLISGGAGFIGSHLCDYYINHNHEVICVDNLITGKKQNIKHLLKNPQFKFIQKDISEKLNIRDKINAVLHFASPASPKYYYRYPIQTLKAGAHGTYNLLELALKNKAKFLLASTSEVYGDPDSNHHPQDEKYWGNVNPVGERAVYDEAKRFAEALTITYQRKKGLDVKIVRIFNTYGPRMSHDDGRLVPNLICQALKNKPLTITGDGKQTRSFCYISDMINGLTKLLNSDITGPINLGNPDELTINDFATFVLELTKAKSQIKYLAPLKDDPKQRCPNIKKAKKYLFWRPKVKLKEGLELTVEWFKTII